MSQICQKFLIHILVQNLHFSASFAEAFHVFMIIKYLKVVSLPVLCIVVSEMCDISVIHSGTDGRTRSWRWVGPRCKLQTTFRSAYFFKQHQNKGVNLDTCYVAKHQNTNESHIYELHCDASVLQIRFRNWNPDHDQRTKCTSCCILTNSLAVPPSTVKHWSSFPLVSRVCTHYVSVSSSRLTLTCIHAWLKRKAQTILQFSNGIQKILLRDPRTAQLLSTLHIPPYPFLQFCFQLLLFQTFHQQNHNIHVIGSDVGVKVMDPCSTCVDRAINKSIAWAHDFFFSFVWSFLRTALVWFVLFKCFVSKNEFSWVVVGA